MCTESESYISQLPYTHLQTYQSSDLSKRCQYADPAFQHIGVHRHQPPDRESHSHQTGGHQ